MFFLQGKPNINSVILVMYYLDQQLTTSALDTWYSKLIKASITLGKKTLNWYYDMTDHLEIYHIAMGQWIYFVLIPSYVLNPFTVLHPHHKLKYFRRAGWKDDWILMVQKIIHKVFEHSYLEVEPVEEEEEPLPTEVHIYCPFQLS